MLPFTFHLIKTTVLPLCFFPMMTDEKQQEVALKVCIFGCAATGLYMSCTTPLYFIWQRQQCYPLCFFSWRPIKNNCYPLWFFSWLPKKNSNVTPNVAFDKIDSVTPYVFPWRQIKNNSVTPYVFFMTINKKQQCYPLCFFSCRPIKNDSVTPYVFFHDDQ